MQIAQVLANYTLGAADFYVVQWVRKNRRKWQNSGKFSLKGLMHVELMNIEHIFDLMEKFAGYGFNKSHSAAYALVAYQTAWLKAHYPAAFMAAVLSSDMDNTDKVVTFIDECAHMRLKVLPPSMNQFYYSFTVMMIATIIYGLGAIKGCR